MQMLVRTLSKHGFWLFLALISPFFWVNSSSAADSIPSKLLHIFADFPSCGLSQKPCFPTPNDHLDPDSPLGFAARIRTNEQYGLPGWTRDLGGRFHKGVDILPVHYEKSDKTVKVDYYDPKSKRSFAEFEPVIVPKDEIYAVLDGTVLVANQDMLRSGYGKYIILEHHFADGSPFVTMYAHLNQVDVREGQKVLRGDHIAWMGNTSSSSGGRMYLSFVPHCHFEVGRIINNNFQNTRYAKTLYPRIIGGNADPRNIQPFDPIQFLSSFKAENRTQLVLTKADVQESQDPDSRNDVLRVNRSRN